MRALKKIPKFNNEAEEQKFWDESDTTEYINWADAKASTMPNLHKTSKSVSLSLPADMIEKIKIKAHKINIPYQSLMKIYISKQLAQEIN